MIYLDNAASTRMDERVLDAMAPFLTEKYAVASSQFSHTPGLEAREGLDRAREIIGGRLNAAPDEIIFTSGGTEANNLAIKGVAEANRNDKNHIICSRIEHNTVLHTCEYLETLGYHITYLDVDEEGFVSVDQVKESISDQTILVSVQHGNQEVGTVQPVEEIASLCRDNNILYHMDAALSFTQLEIDLASLPVDLMTLSAHKIHGPKGIGALYVRKGTKLKKQVHGGYSEFDMRSGTENVAGAVGFGKAVELAEPFRNAAVRALQKHLIDRLQEQIQGVLLNGPADLQSRLPGNVNVSFDLIEGESVVLHLDMRGIAVITGSACFSRSLEASYVMMAMGFTHERAHGSIRFTLSRFNSEEEIEKVIVACEETVNALRNISPLKNKE